MSQKVKSALKLAMMVTTETTTSAPTHARSPSVAMGFSAVTEPSGTRALSSVMTATLRTTTSARMTAGPIAVAMAFCERLVVVARNVMMATISPAMAVQEPVDWKLVGTVSSTPVKCVMMGTTRIGTRAPTPAKWLGAAMACTGRTSLPVKMAMRSVMMGTSWIRTPVSTRVIWPGAVTDFVGRT